VAKSETVWPVPGCPDARTCPPMSRLLRRSASTWGLPAPMGTASPFLRLIPRRDSRKAAREMQHSI
jgi:hypothetical protein